MTSLARFRSSYTLGRGIGLPTVAFVLTLAYLVLGHLSPASIFPDLSHYRMMVWLGLAAALACFPQLFCRPGVWRSSYVYLMLGLITAVAISRVRHGGAAGAFQASIEFFVSAIAFFLVIAAVNNVAKLHVMASCIALSAVYLLSQSLFGWYRDGLGSTYVYMQHTYDSSGARVGEFPRLQSVGFLNDPNDFAQYLLVAASLLTFAWRSGHWRRNMALVVLPVMYLLYGVWATHSRGGFIGVCVMVFFLLEKKVGRIPSLALAACLLCVLFKIQTAGPRPISLHEPSTARRVQALEAGVRIAKVSPFLGVGFHMFEANNMNITAHNSFVLCLAELGILGYCFWLGLIVFSITDLNNIIRARNAFDGDFEIERCASAIRMALFTFVATAFFLSRTYIMTLYLLIGMAAVVSNLVFAKREIETRMVPRRWALTVGFAASSMVVIYAADWLKKF